SAGSRNAPLRVICKGTASRRSPLSRKSAAPRSSCPASSPRSTAARFIETRCRARSNGRRPSASSSRISCCKPALARCSVTQVEMIPKVVPPLTGLSVLVTRPRHQAESLCVLIERMGGKAIRFPTIDIEPQTEAPAEPCDLVIFASTNAVEHGWRLLAPNPQMKVAAIGKATAAALERVDITVHYVPEAGFTSEALLAHPELELEPGMQALIVRGEGGREFLRAELTSRGLTVQTREVYRRVQPTVDPEIIAALETDWSEGGVDVVTLTSVATLDHLRNMLSARGRALLETTALLVVSERIREAARNANLKGHIVVAPAADDASIAGALASWHARARY